MSRKYYITTPIYYVNAKPHIGSTYTTILADILARYHRQFDDKTFFLTGTDEHGAKIEKTAEEKGIEPKQFTDELSNEFKNTWKSLNISNDNFIRTTDENHIKASQKALEYLYKTGIIYKGEYEGLYCVGCEQYKTEKDLVDGHCSEHGTKAQSMKEECYMFKLSSFSDQILKLLKTDKIKISPSQRKNEIISFIEKNKLTDISCSRKNVKWGIRLPWDTEHTAYVWMEAFLNYLTGLGWDGDVKNTPKMWPADVHIMAKDILRVHTTIWPAILLGLGLKTPKEIFVHGYFLVDGQKMSKSIGNVISPEELMAKYGVDGTRYLLSAAAAYGNDGDISWKKFDEKYNADLANGLGNLVARVSNLLEKNNIETKLKINSDKKLIKNYQEKIENYQFMEALDLIWAVIKKCDEDMTKSAPWKLEDVKQIKKVLEPIAQNILNIAELLKPFMPVSAEKIITQFNQLQIKKGESLFPRI